MANQFVCLILAFIMDLETLSFFTHSIHYLVRCLNASGRKENPVLDNNSRQKGTKNKCRDCMKKATIHNA
jgi:hypothetical protein